MSNEFKPVERGWCVGSEEFRQELLAAAAQWIRVTKLRTQRREKEEAKAQWLVGGEMDRKRAKQLTAVVMLGQARGMARKLPVEYPRKIYYANQAVSPRGKSHFVQVSVLAVERP